MISRKFVSDEISGPALLVTDSPNASITITAVEGQKVVNVEVSTRDSADSPSAESVEAATFSQKGNRITVEIPEPQSTVINNVFTGGSGSIIVTGSRSVVIGSNNVVHNGIVTGSGGNGVEVRITVPVGTAVQHDGTNGDLTTYGPINELAAEITNGSINIETVRALKVRSTNGSIRVVRVTGTAEIRSTNGRISVEDYVGTDASVRATNGRISFNIKQPASGRVEIRTSNGSIQVRGAHENKAVEVSTRTSNGSISNH